MDPAQVPPPVVAKAATAAATTTATAAAAAASSSSSFAVVPVASSNKKPPPTPVAGTHPTPQKAFTKSLASLLKYMEGMEMIVELKTGHRHRGILVSADEFMNLTLEGVVTTGSPSPQDHGTSSKRRRTEPATAATTTTTTATTVTTPEQLVDKDDDLFDTIYSCIDIRGPTIRYIQFPDNADLTSTIKSGVDRERAAAKKYNRGKRK